MKKAVLYSGLLLVVVAAVFFAQSGGLGSQPVKYKPQVKLDVQFNNTTETGRIVHRGGDPLSSNYTTRVVVRVIPSDADESVPATISHNGTRVENGVWAASSPPAATDFPLTEGSGVQVLGDGVDSDEDGIAGIEPADKVIVVAYFHGSDWSEDALYLRACPGACDVTKSR